MIGHWDPASWWFFVTYGEHLPKSCLWEKSNGFAPRRKSQIKSRRYLSIAVLLWHQPLNEIHPFFPYSFLMKTMAVLDKVYGDFMCRPCCELLYGKTAEGNLRTLWHQVSQEAGSSHDSRWHRFNFPAPSSHFAIHFNEQRSIVAL